jgi:hypothetical protein
MSSPANLGRVHPIRLSGRERFHESGSPLDISVADFWSWSASDLLSNALRGLVAEFLVASALDASSGIRTEWDAFDVETPGGLKVEVKSAAYIQSWAQSRFSSIRFGIPVSLGWNAESGEWSQEAKRQAQVYVFCLLAHQDQSTIDPLDVAQWIFYVARTSELNDLQPARKSITVASLEALGAKPIRYEDLAASVQVAGDFI